VRHSRLAASLARPLVVAAIGLLALSASARAQEIDCNEPGEREVRSVRFEGNQALSDDELSRRRKAWVAPAPKATTGVLAKYVRLVRSASEGCVTD